MAKDEFESRVSELACGMSLAEANQCASAERQAESLERIANALEKIERHLKPVVGLGPG